MRDVCEKYEDFKTWEKLERNFREIIMKYEKKIWTFLESFKRKLKLENQPKICGKNEKKNSKEFEEIK